MTTEQLKAVEQYLDACETMYFSGSFSEGVIRDDLQARKTNDRISTMTSNPRQTYYLSEKKQFYYKDFDDAEQYLSSIVNGLKNISTNHALIPRCEKCKNQIGKLRNIVRDF